MLKIWDWLNARMVPEWRIWWKMHSIQLGMAATALLTYLAANPDAWTQFVAKLPPEIASTIPVWVGTVVGGTIFFARFWKQYSGDIIAIVKTKSATDSTVEVVKPNTPEGTNDTNTGTG